MRRRRVGVLMEQGSKNERRAPTREGTVLCRSAIHAGRGRVWYSCGERGQRFVVAGLINQARRLCLSFLSESTPFSLRAREGQFTDKTLAGRRDYSPFDRGTSA